MDAADDRAAREALVRGLVEQGRVNEAATAALRLYGDEVCGYLHAIARDDELAADGFAGFSEDLWRGLPGFRWASSLRTWCYAIARHALWRQRRGPRGRAVPLDEAHDLQAAAAQIRTATAQFMRTEVKDEFRKLRDELSEEELEILILRVDRQLPWRDVADALPDPSRTVDQRAAGLRKQFERIKGRLRELAKARGLLAPEL